MIEQAKAAGVYVGGGGIDEAVPPVLVSAEDSFAKGGYPWATPLNGGFAVLEQPRAKRPSVVRAPGEGLTVRARATRLRVRPAVLSRTAEQGVRQVRAETDTVALSARAKRLVAEITRGNVKLGDLKAHGNAIKKDHSLAMELWSTGQYYPRLLATLVFDKKLLTEKVIDQLASDMLRHDADERSQLADWLLANQLAKDKKLVALIATWEKKPSPILRRLFWYHQARLRWVGQAPPGNSADLLDSLETHMADAEPEVQWAMNFCACQIGVHEPKFRSRCIKLGETLGLYKDEHVAKNCTPSYLPEFVRIEVAKRK